VGLTLQALAACRMEDARDLAQQVISNAQTLFAW
jgi:hypothetical protein